MKTNYEEVKDSLLFFGKKHLACQYEYKRLYAAESVEAVMAVVKDNFSWCCQFYDFADVLLAYRDQFAEHKIWINTSVEIKEGVGCLLTTEGEFNARSWGTSTINAESWGTSTINARSRETSTINARSWGTSTMIIPTSAIECQVNDKSIARYIQDNRVVFADDSIKFEKQG
jgi:hypothetical protein